MDAKPSKPNRSNNRNRNKNKKRFSAKNASGQSVRPAGNKPKSDSQKSKNSGYKSSNKRRYNRSRSADKRSPIDKLIRKYEHFMDMYLAARKKYFGLLFTADKAQKAKLERGYKSATNQLREFEQTIPEDLRPQFDQYIGVAKLDTEYSENLAESGTKETTEIETEIVDPHLLRSQIECDFKGETDESVATEEDFAVYSKITQQS